MALGKQIRKYREHREWTLEQLSSASGVPVGTIGALENRDSSRSMYASKIASAFGVSVETLIESDPHDQAYAREFSNVSPGPKVRGTVPLLNKVNAGMYKEVIDHGADVEYIATVAPVKRYTFALRVEGDSMEPTFTNGMIVIIEPDMDPMPNDYVVAVNGDNEATFKQLVKDGPDWFLKPLNPRYPIRPLGSARVIGVCTGAHITFRRGEL